MTEVTLQRNGCSFRWLFGAYLFWKTDYTDDRYDQLLLDCMKDMYLYRNRRVLAGPHLEFTHMTTIWREHVFLTSAPMLMQKDTIGKYVITYRSGREVEIPLIYGVNIMNQAVEWDRTPNEEMDCYDADGSLAEVTYTTLPMRQPDGTTQYRYVVENPYPDDQVVGVRTEKTAPDEGEIFLTDFAVRQSFADSPIVRASLDPNRRIKTPLY